MTPHQMRAAHEWLRERYPHAEIREDGVGLLIFEGEDQPGVRVHERDRYIDIDEGGLSVTVPIGDDVVEALERAHAAYGAYRLWAPRGAR